ncbi:hypothetical protein BDY17DRAFT_293416 [Neohortaea acidophila]|uniref:Myb-like DNA-binding domain-containing protein n=1 Tax=Neohortaea acidophila TaxID=245834 RepID=A0A6A6PYY4_9PEZI|nr:uncharacterized protein BDY17DRAFT_293416 [Neohortaea acidophila]KAF2485350.1 hypothetical protein BDY17DRAFT_293416 [Neohortaea acidophila]
MELDNMQLDPRLSRVEGVGDVFDWSNNNPALKDPEDELGYNPQINNSGYDEQLRDDRRRNRAKLRNRFEHIFDKYGRDFDGVADEIDLSTGDIVVDNGHLKNMRHEADVGERIQSEAQGAEEQAPAGNGEPEDAVQNAQHTIVEESGREYDADSDDAESSFEEAESGAFSSAHSPAESVTSLFEPDESEAENNLGIASAKRRSISAALPLPGVLPHPDDSDTTSDDDMSEAGPNDILEQVPGLKESMLSLQSRYEAGGAVSQDDIQALGMSIAKQLASFVSTGIPRASKLKRKPHKATPHDWTYPAASNEPPAKRQRQTLSPYPDLADPSPKQKSIWALGGHPRKQIRKRKAEYEAEKACAGTPIDTPPVIEDDSSMPLPVLEIDAQTGDGEKRKCTHCATSDTRLWRKGPHGHLCNGCGMYLYRYGLLRPLDATGDDDTSRPPDETDGEMDPLLRDWLDHHDSTSKKDDPKPLGVSNTKFQLEEDALLIRLKEIEQLSWEGMAQYFQGRSAYALQCRHSKKLQRQAPEARALLVSQGYRGKPDAAGVIVFSYTTAPFNDLEDELLLQLRDEQGLAWEEVARSMEGRSPYMLERRYRELAMQIISGMSTTPKLPNRRAALRPVPNPKNPTYTEEEDALIVKYREADKLQWKEIAKVMQGRNSLSLQKRYIRELCGRHPDSIMPARKAYNHEVDGMKYGNISKYGRTFSAPPGATNGIDGMLIREKPFQDWGFADGTGTIVHSVENPEPEAMRFDSLSRPTRMPAYDPTMRHSMPVLPERSAWLEEPTPSKSFTAEEDELIVKLRETEDRAWPFIAEQMVYYTIPEITERYYYHLLPQRARRIQAAIQGFGDVGFIEPLATAWMRRKVPEVSQNKKWTTHETDLLVMLRDRGQTWREIAAQLPGRTARRVEVHYVTLFGKGKSAAQAASKMPTPGQSASSSTGPLLSLPGQMVGQSTKSGRTYKLLLPKPDPRHGAANEGVAFSSPSLAPPVQLATAIQNTRVLATPLQLPPHHTAGSLALPSLGPGHLATLSQKFAPLLPPVAPDGAIAPYMDDLADPPVPRYDAPRQFGKDEIFTCESSRRLADDDAGPKSPVQLADATGNIDIETAGSENSGLHVQNDASFAFLPDLHETPMRVEHTVLSAATTPAITGAYDTPARYNSTGYPYFVNPVAIQPFASVGGSAKEPEEAATAREHSVYEVVDEEVVKPSGRASKSTRKRPAKPPTTAKTKLRAREPKVPRSKPGASVRARKASRRRRETTVDETSEDDDGATIVYASTSDDDDDELSKDDEESVYDFVDHDEYKDNETRAGSIHRDEMSGPDCEAANKQLEYEATLVFELVQDPKSTAKATAEDDTMPRDSMDLEPIDRSGEQVPIEGGQHPPETANLATSPSEKPRYNAVELAKIALESRAPEAMTTSEVYDYLAARFGFEQTAVWKHGIRAALSRHSQFAKASEKQGKGWILTESRGKRTSLGTKIELPPLLPSGPIVAEASPEGKPRRRGRASKSDAKIAENVTGTEMAATTTTSPPEGAPRRRGRPAKSRVRVAEEITGEEAASATSVSANVEPEGDADILMVDVQQDEPPPRRGKPRKARAKVAKKAAGKEAASATAVSANVDAEGDVDTSMEDAEQEQSLVPTIQKAVSGNEQAERSPDSNPRAIRQLEGNDKDPLQDHTGAPTRPLLSNGITAQSPEVSASSSPAFTKRQSPRVVYRHVTTTPASDNSALLKRVHKRRSAPFATPAPAGEKMGSRASSVALDGRRRVVYTPAREVGDSEDELA